MMKIQVEQTMTDEHMAIAGATTGCAVLKKRKYRLVEAVDPF